MHDALKVHWQLLYGNNTFVTAYKLLYCTMYMAMHDFDNFYEMDWLQ